MSYIDLILGVCLLISLISGIRKGFVHQLTSFAALIIGLLAAVCFSKYAAAVIGRALDLGPAKNVVAFALTFLIALIAIRILGKWIGKLTAALMLGFLDKILGGCFSVLKWSLILSLSLIVFHALNSRITLIQPAVLSRSKLYYPIKNIIPNVFPSAETWYESYIKPAVKGVEQKLGDA
ncbi:MAG: CvpA family protein [Flavobacteriales bacterium]